MRNLISPFYPSQTQPSLNRLHSIVDIDKGRIPNNPRLQGGRVPEDVYATKPFYFGASNVRMYRNVRGEGRLHNNIAKAMRIGATLPMGLSQGTGCCKACGTGNRGGRFKG
jgi:hypothetical protein